MYVDVTCFINYGITLYFQIRFFKTIGGGDGVSVVINIMKKLITNEVATHFNWFGLSNKVMKEATKKRAFGKTNTWNFILGKLLFFLLWRENTNLFDVNWQKCIYIINFDSLHGFYQYIYIYILILSYNFQFINEVKTKNCTTCFINWIVSK